MSMAFAGSRAATIIIRDNQQLIRRASVPGSAPSSLFPKRWTLLLRLASSCSMCSVLLLSSNER